MIDFLMTAGLVGLGFGTIAWLAFMLFCLGFTVFASAMLFYVTYIWKDPDEI
jgi:hypothetical protein